MKHPIRHAFTLIELLVVISLISLLVAILLPALASVRSAGQRSASLSNVRQIANAMHLYAADNKNSFPFRAFENLEFPQIPVGPFTTNVPYWGGVLVVRGGYLVSPSVLWGPSRIPWYVSSLAAMTSNVNHPNYNRVGYAVNENILPFRSEVTGRRIPLRPDQQGQPDNGKAVFLVEAFDNSALSIPQDGLNGIVPRTLLSGTRIFSHGSSVVRAYVDTHATAGNGLELGWDTGAGNGRDGTWVYTSNPQFLYVAPWYHQWYSQP
jgi:prepilin-type N-terminal cleavage/methylation domain-containing protein